MNRLISLITLILSCLPLRISAQDNAWMENAPEKYLPSTTQTIVSASSPCNQGEEAFKNFIPKFRSNKTFRNSRTRFDDEMGQMMFDTLADWNSGNGYALLKAVNKNTRCDKSFGTWFNISANEVCFIYQDVLPCDEWGGSTLLARLQRIEGKWYMTTPIMAG